MARISIPSEVTTIGDSAFCNSSLLIVAIIPTTPPILAGANVFSGTESNMKIYVPDESVNAYKTAQYWSGYENKIKSSTFVTNDCPGLILILTSGSSLAVKAANTSISGDIRITTKSIYKDNAFFDIEEMADSAFYNCSSVTSITFTDVFFKRIGKSAFEGCSNLTNLNIKYSSTLKSIEQYTFYGCSRLTSINIPSSVTSIGNYAFINCSSLTNITIPSNVTSIGNRAFYNCSGLTSIILGPTNPPILYDTNVFAYTNNAPIYVPTASLNAYRTSQSWSLLAYRIQGYTFTIGNLTYTITDITNKTVSVKAANTSISGNITIPATANTFNVTSIEDSAFYNCSGVTSITIPSTINRIGKDGFRGCSRLTSITIPSSVTSIGDRAFYECSSLTSIEIPNSVTSIGTHVFNNCVSLTSVNIPSSITEIGMRTFYKCSSLTNINIPSSVTSIGQDAFRLSGLTSITIPSNVTSIEAGAFYGCSGLTSITLEPTTPPTLANANAFESTNNAPIYVPAASLNAYRTSQSWSLLANRILPLSFTKDNLTYTATGTNTVSVKAANTSISGEITIPATVTEGGVTFNVTSIEEYGFESCNNLTSVTIPSSVTSIGYHAFYNCSGLTSITLEPTTPPNLASADAFASTPAIIYVSAASVKTYREAQNWSNLVNQIYPLPFTQGDFAYTATSAYTVSVKAANTSISGIITIPETVTESDVTYTVTSIENEGFINCSNLTDVIIRSSVTNIGENAFRGCSGLTSITLEPTTPPTLANADVFTGVPTSATFYLPNTSYLSAKYWSDILRNYNVVIPNTNVLRTNRWNFVAGLGNEASLYNSNNPASFVNGFTANTSLNDVTNQQNPHCDIAIVGYDYTNNNWNTGSLYADSTMKKGAGYFVWPFNENAKGTTITSDGTITTVSTATNYTTSGSIDWEATNNGSANTSGTGTDVVSAKWFAFGNPFDKDLSKTAILAAFGSNVQSNVLYTYNANQGTWNNNATVILPGQGFMVASRPERSTLSAIIDYPTVHSAPAQPESYGIRFTLTSNGINSDMFAKQNSEANDGFDTKDAYALFGNNENLVEPYFVVEGRQIIHNRYNSDNYACDVNFHAQKSGVAELSVSDVPEGTTVSIVDLTMNTETVLENEPYQIDVEAGENANRYQIKINKGSVSLPQTIENEANISIWNNNKEIFVKGENLQRVEVYNTLGQMVYQKAISGESYNFTFDNEGAYVVKAICSNGTKSQKIVIR